MKRRLWFLFGFLLAPALLAEVRTWTFQATGDLAPLATKDHVQIRGDDGKAITVWRTNLTFRGEAVALVTNKVAILQKPDGTRIHNVVPMGWTNLQSITRPIDAPGQAISIVIRGEDGQRIQGTVAPGWTNDLVQGSKLIGFITNKTIIIRRPNGDLFQPPLANLVPEDRAYVAQFEVDVRKSWFQQEIINFRQKGYREITNKTTIQSQAAELAGSRCWMDARFEALDLDNPEIPPTDLGFSVRDRDSGLFGKCRVPKDGRKDAQVLKLRRGDTVRLLGTMVIFPAEIVGDRITFDTAGAEFRIDSVELIEAARQTPP
jgi:hypothetical protein